jgi:hypothetical protein
MAWSEGRSGAAVLLTLQSRFWNAIRRVQPQEVGFV